MKNHDRSFEHINSFDLKRLQQIAFETISELYIRRPGVSGKFSNSLFNICFCQGAALHYMQKNENLDELHGIKDFDLWCFHSRIGEEIKFPPRWRGVRDFGKSKFGKDNAIAKNFAGSKVDVMGRDIDKREDETGKQEIRRYLREKSTETARYLSLRPVIAIWPDDVFGEVFWPLSAEMLTKKGV